MSGIPSPFLEDDKDDEDRDFFIGLEKEGEENICPFFPQTFIELPEDIRYSSSKKE